MKRWIIITLGSVAVLAIGFLLVVFYVRSTNSWAKTLKWDEPNLSAVADGVYEGTAAVDMPAGTAAANTSVTVRVTVTSHRYSAVEVIAPERLAGPMAGYAGFIVSAQSLHPDGISGATVTKSLVLMATANAVRAK